MMSLSARECWPIDKMVVDEMSVNEMPADVKMCYYCRQALNFLFCSMLFQKVADILIIKMSLSARECWPIDIMAVDEMFINEMTVDVKMCCCC
jgi:hypothetical protein